MQPTEGYVLPDDGVRLFFQTLGNGAQTVVIPNGFYLRHDFAPLAEGRTLVFYDARNRGRSDSVTEPSKLAHGIHNDVEDLEAVRLHFGISELNVIGHSYMGVMVMLHAIKYRLRSNGIVQIGPMQPRHDAEYPAHLTNRDAVLRDVSAKLGELQRQRASQDPTDFCRTSWSVLRQLYVADPADADKIKWERCDLPNERNFMQYWMGTILPSIQALTLTRESLAKVTAPVLTIHGTKDRSAPYGGGRHWVSLLPNARLITVDKAGHAPWIEAPDRVFGSIKTFLGGSWPSAAEEILSADVSEARPKQR